MRAYLHRFVSSDPDRGLHDHPWPWAFSILLAGWYWEVTRSGSHRVRWFSTLPGDTFHCGVLPLDRGVDSVWTLLVHRARDATEWGILHDKARFGSAPAAPAAMQIVES
jgi:hypothetical protein